MAFVFDERASDSPFVERVWRTHSERAGSFISIASTPWELVVRRGDGRTLITIHGPETKATHFDFPAGPEWFGITFKLGTFMPKLPLRNCIDHQNASLPEATSQSFWLNSSTWQFPDYENADTFVARLEREGLLAYDPVVDTVLQGQPHALSIRSLQYRFLQATGLTHKMIEQITRARYAVTFLEQGTSILDTTYNAGYCDQAHLTRSLKHFIGQTPSQIATVRQTVNLP